MEAQYIKAPEDTDQSVLAIVGRDRKALADQFRGWRSENSGGDFLEAVRRFEVMRFGSQLYGSAHGILRFAITHAKDAEAQPSRPHLSGPERQKRFDEAVGRKARESSWPKPPGEERMAELRSQAESLAEPAERPTLGDA